ncbi:MAG: DUF3883 domain-containing protein [Gemmatimonadota bacterium]|nr:DUF3883 domain-containing protein [Gemmatimonadota bacterium]
MAADDWSRAEVEATVADYFAMLEAELRGAPYSKAEHRRALVKLLNDRSEQSVEFKHANISAVLIELGIPYISGYKPRFNYQRLLAVVVAERLAGQDHLIRVVADDVDKVVVPSFDDLLGALVAAPTGLSSKPKVAELAKPPYSPGLPRPVVNYLEREARNRALGAAGEEFVLQFEQARLVHAGCEHLASKIAHISKSHGDGAGYDILSFEHSGAERLIEVKTTKYGRETPFFVSRNELAVSQANAERYQLYRVFELRSNVKLFTLPGAFSSTCQLEPSTYQASVA